MNEGLSAADGPISSYSKAAFDILFRECLTTGCCVAADEVNLINGSRVR